MRRARISAIALVYFLAACGSPTKDVYNVSEVGQIQEVREGRIVQSRFIDIDAKDSGRGTVAGGIAGGLGSLLAVGGGFGLAAFLLGSAVGAVVGYVAEDVATDRDGIEYIISLDDGSTATMAIQNRGDEDEPLPPGTEIFPAVRQQLHPAHRAAPKHAGTLERSGRLGQSRRTVARTG